MTLGARSRLAVALSALALAVLAGAIVVTERAAAANFATTRQAIELARQAALLRTLVTETAVNPTQRHWQQWKAGLSALEALLGEMNAIEPAHAPHTARLHERLARADSLFQRLAALRDPLGPPESHDFRERTAGFLSIALQIEAAEVVREALDFAGGEVGTLFVASQWARGLVVLLAITLLAVIVAHLLLVERGILRPLRRLQRAMSEVAAGRLEARSGVGGRDEIGELGRHFDQMAEQREQAQRRLEAANRELESFSYSVSHDLRAPLRGVDGYSQILEEDYGGQLDDEARRVIGVIRHSAQEMGQLIDDLLAFSQTGRAALDPQAVDTAALVAGIIEGMRPEIGERPVEFALGPLPVVVADRALLKQVWVNLLANAVKFSRTRPTPRIEVAHRREGVEDVFLVRDNGVGFDMRYAGKLFGVFQRLHRSDEFEGTGVGLALVQRIVSRHGGRVWAEAAPEAGATFRFTLPFGGS